MGGVHFLSCGCGLGGMCWKYGCILLSSTEVVCLIKVGSEVDNFGSY
jgi:hypothetical protein